MKVPSSHVITDIRTLEEQHDIRREAAFSALETLGEVRRQALLQLQKTRILFKRLNWKQRESFGNHKDGAFFLQRMYALPVPPPDVLDHRVIPAYAERTASSVQRVKTLRKNIIRLSAVEARAKELSGAIVKSIAVFNHHYKTVSRTLFPLGIVSKTRRSLGRFFDHPYYSWREIGCLCDLGAAAGFVLKIAEAPVVGAL